MPRQLRIQYEGAFYHVMNRGDHREAIFKDDSDRERFLVTLAEACAKTGWQIHAYCLMNNHFHLVLETPHANLVEGMKWFLGTYTNRFNRRHKLFGHLFGGRYKSLLVDGHQEGYFKAACEYVHLNPVRAKLLKPEQPLREYRWSSFSDYLQPPNRRAPWVRVDRLLGGMRIFQDSVAGRQEFERQLEARRLSETDSDWKDFRRGWYFGDETFRQELLAQVAEGSGPSHYAQPKQQSAAELAEQLVVDELHQMAWSEANLAERRKGDPAKVRIARRLRKETAVSLKWIAQRLHMGAWTHVANLIYARVPAKEEPAKQDKAVEVNQNPGSQAQNPGNQAEPSISSETTSVSLVRTDPLPLHCL
ncbi:MAG: transposase [Chloroflexi bacterium]|nr:transposase [Chloroflexota bacterium]